MSQKNAQSRSTPSLLWATVEKRKIQNNVPMPSVTSTSQAQLNAQNPNATSLRLLLTKTESSLEQFSSNVHGLLKEVVTAKEAIGTTSEVQSRKIDELHQTIQVYVNTSQASLQESLKHSENTLQQILTNQQALDTKFALLESHFVRFLLENASEKSQNSATTQTQLQSVINHTNELRTDIASLTRNLVPEVQAIPMHIHTSAAELTNRLLVQIVDRALSISSTSRSIARISSNVEDTPPIRLTAQELDPGWTHQEGNVPFLYNQSERPGSPSSARINVSVLPTPPTQTPADLTTDDPGPSIEENREGVIPDSNFELADSGRTRPNFFDTDIFPYGLSSRRAKAGKRNAEALLDKTNLTNEPNFTSLSSTRLFGRQGSGLHLEHLPRGSVVHATYETSSPSVKTQAFPSRATVDDTRKRRRINPKAAAMLEAFNGDGISTSDDEWPTVA